MLLRRWLQIVYLTQLRTYIPVRLLPRHLILVVIARVSLLTPLALYLEHIGNVNLVGLQTLHLMLLRLFDTIPVNCVPKDNSVQSRQIYILGLRVVCQRNWVLVFCTLAQLRHLLLLVPVSVV